jgi:hypothetical protein
MMTSAAERPELVKRALLVEKLSIAWMAAERRAMREELDEFARRMKFVLLDIPVYVASPEDTIVAKLEWSKQSGGSERQRRDVAGILATLGQAVDQGPGGQAPLLRPVGVARDAPLRLADGLRALRPRGAQREHRLPH